MGSPSGDGVSLWVGQSMLGGRSVKHGGSVSSDNVSLQLVTACAMQAFHSLFSAQPSTSCLPAELNAQIITVSAGTDREGWGYWHHCSQHHFAPNPRHCTTTCPMPVTCSRCSPGCPPWRGHTSTWAGGERLALGRGKTELHLSPFFSLFSRLQKDLCWAHLPRLFSATMNCFLSPHSQVVAAAAQTLEVPSAHCLGPCGQAGIWDLPGHLRLLCVGS